MTAHNNTRQRSRSEYLSPRETFIFYHQLTVFLSSPNPILLLLLRGRFRMKEREEMWQKIEELARLNPQVRFSCHCCEPRGQPILSWGEFVRGGIWGTQASKPLKWLSPLVHVSSHSVSHVPSSSTTAPCVFDGDRDPHS